MPEFRPLNSDEIAELQEQSDHLYESGLTKGCRDSEKEAVDAYTQVGYISTNRYLYGEQRFSEKVLNRIQKDLSLIDSAMSKWELKHGVTVYSGKEAVHYDGWDVGDIKSISAYLSTSVTVASAQVFCDQLVARGKKPIMLEIYAAKGVRSIYIGDNTAYEKPQDEFLLGRGLSYKVIERTDTTLKLEVAP